jgi:anthranilate phosphoribosyltransferase
MIVEATNKALSGKNLSRDEAEAVMEIVLSGGASDAQIVSLLTALRTKGETVDELVGFATSMRRHAAPVFPNGRAEAEEMLVDTCGTGGDASGTFNISTATAFVVAGAGVRVAKHGNRSISSRCGSADVLEALGIAIDASGLHAGEAIMRIGIGFLFAPAMHAAMKHAMPARRQIGGHTVFNLLGPLTNPAGALAQVVGVFDPAWAERLARALGELGIRRAFVVHGADGLDEISLAGESYVAELRDRTVRNYFVAPEDFGLQRASLEAVAGGDAEYNAGIIRRILEGEKGPQRDVVLANAAAALVAAERAADFQEGARLAAAAIDSGAARTKLHDLAAFAPSKK